MHKPFQIIKTQPTKTNLILTPDTTICQIDYPLDWYQKEFVPYAEEYLALPDRKRKTVLRWMKKYIEPAQKRLGDRLLLLAHYYMGGEIVKLVEAFGGLIGDSYQLALMAYRNPKKKSIVESAVHFMAESIRILAHDDQTVYITNPKAGCTMEMYAKDYMVEPAIAALNARYGEKTIIPICYVNTSGRVKALTGAQNGSACTSSNAKKILKWALEKENKKILFIPDQHLGRNTATWLDIPESKIVCWPCGEESLSFNLEQQEPAIRKKFDKARVILFGSSCSVHTHFKPEMVTYWQSHGFTVIVHPECTIETVKAADHYGSTAFLWDFALNDRAHTKKYAIGTENHMVQNLKEVCLAKGIEIVNLAEAILDHNPGFGCGCATMSRNDPPHLVALLDLLSRDLVPDYNEVQSGDIVNEYTGMRERLDPDSQAWVNLNARKALAKMIEITEK